jgi:hypothetical protein
MGIDALIVLPPGAEQRAGRQWLEDEFPVGSLVLDKIEATAAEKASAHPHARPIP